MNRWVELSVVFTWESDDETRDIRISQKRSDGLLLEASVESDVLLDVLDALKVSGAPEVFVVPLAGVGDGSH